MSAHLSDQHPAATRRAPVMRGLRIALLVALLLAVWTAFAPPRLGGAFSYIFIFGESMEPAFSEGDLVLLRERDRYEVGDVIAYTDPLIGQVFHRVIARDGLSYVTRGDNRTNTDPFQPVHADILGSRWVHIPNGGTVVNAVQEPRNTLLLLGATVVLSVSTQAARPARRRGRRRAAEASSPIAYGSITGDALLSIGVALIATGGVIAAIAWSNETQETVRVDVPYSQNGAFSYGGVGPAGLYDDATIETGDPVFTELISLLPVTYDYRIAPELMDPLSGTTGTIQLDAVLTQDNGWQRTFPLQPATPFSGNEAQATGILDLAAMRAEAQAMQEATGLFFLEFGVSLIAQVETESTLAGQPITDALTSDLRFRLTSFDLRLLTRDEEVSDSVSGLITRPETGERAITIPTVDWEISYATMRRLALGTAAGGAALLLVVGVASLLVQRGGAAARINARYQRMLVSVRARDIDFSGRIVGVNSFDDLVRIATTDGLLILHTESATADHYMVVEPEATYVFEVPGTPAAPHAGAADAPLGEDGDEEPLRWDRSLFDEVFNADDEEDDR